MDDAGGADTHTHRWEGLDLKHQALCFWVLARELTFQRMVAEALRVGCKTSGCQSGHTDIYTLPGEA